MFGYYIGSIEAPASYWTVWWGVGRHEESSLPFLSTRRASNSSVRDKRTTFIVTKSSPNTGRFWKMFQWKSPWEMLRKSGQISSTSAMPLQSARAIFPNSGFLRQPFDSVLLDRHRGIGLPSCKLGGNRLTRSAYWPLLGGNFAVQADWGSRWASWSDNRKSPRISPQNDTCEPNLDHLGSDSK
jgi:hypothetical protein